MVMAFLGLGKLLYVSVLLINAVAVLSEDRFLARVGWGKVQVDTGFGNQQDPGVKQRIIELITAVRSLMRIPLIVLNTMIICWEIVFG